MFIRRVLDIAKDWDDRVLKICIENLSQNHLLSCSKTNVLSVCLSLFSDNLSVELSVGVMFGIAPSAV
jgi:hypothetical protein